MQGSFSPESAERFIQLMAAEGYETHDVSSGKGLQNFSAGLNNRVDVWEAAAENFSETRGEYIDNYDFTRCVRPDGSSYGSRGKCKKGTETSEKAKKELTPDEKWMQDRVETMKSLKGKSKEELLSILSQHRRIHGLTKKDSVRDIVGGILGSIHGNDSPSEAKEKRASRTAAIQRRREEQKRREEEQSAIDQLSRMLPKGEKIMDSLGQISIATGGAK